MGVRYDMKALLLCVGALLLAGCRPSATRPRNVADGIVLETDTNGAVWVTLEPERQVRIRNNTGYISVYRSGGSARSLGGLTGMTIRQVEEEDPVLRFSVHLHSPSNRIVVTQTRTSNGVARCYDADGDGVPEHRWVDSTVTGTTEVYRLRSLEWTKTRTIGRD